MTGSDESGHDRDAGDQDAGPADDANGAGPGPDYEAHGGAPEGGESDEVADAEILDAADVSAAVDDVFADDDPLALALNQRDEYLDSLRRLQAEFENYKKAGGQAAGRSGSPGRRCPWWTRCCPVLDTLDLATQHLGDADSADGRALLAVTSQLHDVLAKEGLERIDPLGEQFDPTAHEAVGHLPAEDVPPSPVARKPRRGSTGELRAGGGPGHAARVPLAGGRGPPGHGDGAGLTARRRQEGISRHRVAPQREWFEKDYYKTLGVSSTATPKEITSAYRKLAKQHHPDTNPGHEETLQGDLRGLRRAGGRRPSARSTTRSARMGPAAGAWAASPAGSAVGGSYRVEDMGDLGRHLRRPVRPGTAGGGGSSGPQRGSRCRDRAAPVLRGRRLRGHHLGQPDHRTSRCHTCGGNGAAPALHPVTCPRLRGHRHPPGQPGAVLAQPDLPAVRGTRHRGPPRPAPPVRAPAWSTATVR